jgi:hypothetical protein
MGVEGMHRAVDDVDGTLLGKESQQGIVEPCGVWI